MKLAFVSPFLPPSWSGQAVVIYRLLKDLSAEDYCLISKQDYRTEAFRGSYSRRLPGKYYRLSSGVQIAPDGRFRRLKRLELVNMLRIVSWSGQIASIVRRENCGAIVACTAGLLEMPAGYLASRLAGVPFYPYIFDYYSYQWTDPLKRRFAEFFEPIVLRGAAGIIVPNEFMRDELFNRYSVESTVIHNPCDLAPYRAAPNGELTRNNGEIKIVYTGAVYEAHYDAFRNLLAAIERLAQPNLKLHLYTAQLPHDLEEKGLDGPIVFHEHQATSFMPGIQQQASLLFLPLAFSSPYPEVIRTSSPGKIGEYLAARRPILVHAPADTFVAWYFRQHECGLVVDKCDPGELAQAIERILQNADLRQGLGTRAWDRACSDFGLPVVQARFGRLVKLSVNGLSRS